MNRRGFLATSAGAAYFMTPAPHLVEVSCCRSGRFVPGIRILMDGKDISDDCFRAEKFSDGKGVAYCYARDDKGWFFLRPDGNVAEHQVSGEIEIIPPEYIELGAWAVLQKHWLEAERG